MFSMTGSFGQWYVLVIFFSLTEAPLPDPTQRTRNELKSSFLGWDGRGVSRHGGGGVVREKEDHQYVSNFGTLRPWYNARVSGSQNKCLCGFSGPSCIVEVPPPPPAAKEVQQGAVVVLSSEGEVPPNEAGAQVPDLSLSLYLFFSSLSLYLSLSLSLSIDLSIDLYIYTHTPLSLSLSLSPLSLPLSLSLSVSLSLSICFSLSLYIYIFSLLPSVRNSTWNSFSPMITLSLLQQGFG